MNTRTAKAWGVTLALSMTVGANAISGAPTSAAPIEPTATASSSAASAPTTFIVSVAPGYTDHVSYAVASMGATVIDRLDMTGDLVVSIDGSSANALLDIEGVDGITADRTVAPQKRNWKDRNSSAGSIYNVNTTINSRSMWKKDGGRKIGIAVVDTGIDDSHPALDDGKVMAAVDLSGEHDPSADGTGHGTYIASIIAGNEDYEAGQKSKWRDSYENAGDFIGIAPDAHLINVKVADRTGATTSSTLLAGLEWIYDHRDDKDLNIRVVNLSFGAPATDDPLADPLNAAVEALWDAGIVVVVSAGNGGNGTGLLSPAVDGYVIAVGASDSGTTASVFDDGLADFTATSSTGRSVDVLAPGRSIEGALAAGSAAEAAQGNLGNGYIIGSGTSQAAAVVSGTVALLLDKKKATPDELKAKLLLSAHELPSLTPADQGAGVIDVAAAAETKVKKDRVRQNHRKAHGRGQISADVDAEANGSRWTGSRWTGSRWTGSRWTGSRWTGSRWTGSRWMSQWD